TVIFAERLNGSPESQLQSTGAIPYITVRNLPINTWGGILGYQAGVMNPLASKTQYSPWDVLSQSASIYPNMRYQQQGSQGEYNISGGFNFQNTLYVGFSVGIQDIYYRGENNYFEYYENNSQTLRNMNYIQATKMDGTGVNFKFGVVVRPVSNLRIGVAVHTPTYIGINEEYIEYLSADYSTTGPGKLLDSPFSLNRYNIQTPTRFLTGISYTVPNVGLITFDYERVWYNGMRLKNMDGNNWNYEQAIKEEVKELFKPATNLRVGLELIPMKSLYLRAGYAHYGDCMRLSSAIFTNQTNITSYQNYSGGIGFRIGQFYADLTYIYTDYKYAPFDLFYYEDQDVQIGSGTAHNQAIRHTVSLSAGMKF
ncbi:MAG: hypothetical protein PHV49_04420, partial [Alistipes sp.]|nr:hypothetical protein [Alistipes sp.]